MSGAPVISASVKDTLAKVRKMVPPMLERTTWTDSSHRRLQGVRSSTPRTLNRPARPSTDMIKVHRSALLLRHGLRAPRRRHGKPSFTSTSQSSSANPSQSHVICEPTAAAVIKTYSPNLMVHPLMRQSGTSYPDDSEPPTASTVASTVIEMLPRLHVIVMGPGLGRDPLMQATCAKILAAARDQKVPVVLDADGLALVVNDPELVRGWADVVLTPNVVEFGRLADKLGVDVKGGKKEEVCKLVAEKLGGVCVIQKGGVDYISNGTKTWICDLVGGKKRSGGQGDTLTGSVGTLLCWRKAYLEGLWDTEGKMDEGELLMLAAFGGSAITRECSRLAFAKVGRALQASDVGDNVPTAFETLIGEKEESKL
ncbi:MAG: hypothetical protein MMC23_008874 [Stictis urceolatum]|nr:hypothetical protein [Stictis urceolata]